TAGGATPGRNSGNADPSHPLRENLEIRGSVGAEQVRCTRCGHALCNADQDWTAAALRVLLPPTAAGPRMAPLLSHFVLQHLCGPGCGALRETARVEARQADR